MKKFFDEVKIYFCFCAFPVERIRIMRYNEKKASAKKRGLSQTIKDAAVFCEIMGNEWK